MNQLASAIEK